MSAFVELENSRSFLAVIKKGKIFKLKVCSSFFLKNEYVRCWCDFFLQKIILSSKRFMAASKSSLYPIHLFESFWSQSNSLSRGDRVVHTIATVQKMLCANYENDGNCNKMFDLWQVWNKRPFLSDHLERTKLQNFGTNVRNGFSIWSQITQKSNIFLNSKSLARLPEFYYTQFFRNSVTVPHQKSVKIKFKIFVTEFNYAQHWNYFLYIFCQSYYDCFMILWYSCLLKVWKPT